MSERTLSYQVAQFIAGSTDDPAYYALLEENDELCRELERVRQQNHELAQVMLHLNNDKAVLFRAVQYAIGEMTAPRSRKGEAAAVLEKVLEEVRG